MTVTSMSNSKAAAVVAILIAIGAVLRMFSPNILGITPNFIISMYCLSIVLLRPNLKGAVGIGLVAGLVSMVFSKSPIPAINLVSEPLGAMACFLMVKLLPELNINKYSFKPIVSTLVATLISGTSYLLLSFTLLQMPAQAVQAALIGVVLPVTVINGLMSQIFYAPAKRVLKL